MLVVQSACAAEDEGGRSGGALTCAELDYCSSYWVVGDDVTALPQPTGGTIADGFYVLSDTLAEGAVVEDLRHVIRFERGEYLRSDTGHHGSIATNGNRITFTPDAFCRDGEATSTSAEASTLDYSADGSSLTLYFYDRFSETTTSESLRVALVYARVESTELCEPIGTTICTIEDCFCAATADGVLEDSQCGR